MSKTREAAGRLVVLDALRGVAALAVVAYHAGVGSGRQAFQHGYLAVDFFFALSGFVLVYAYQARLDHGLATLQFLRLRLARLYPLYFLGLLLGVLRELNHLHRAQYPIPHTWFLFLLGMGLLLLPSPHHTGIPIPEAFPFNFPAWSLFHELLANVAHALFVRRRGWLFLCALTGVSGLAFLLISIHARRVDFGAQNTNTLLAVPRVFFSYSVGMLLCRWRDHGQRWRVASWITSPLILGIALLAAMGAPLGRYALGYDLAMIVFVFPAILLAGASGDVPLKRGLCLKCWGCLLTRYTSCIYRAPSMLCRCGSG